MHMSFLSIFNRSSFLPNLAVLFNSKTLKTYKKNIGKLEENGSWGI